MVEKVLYLCSNYGGHKDEKRLIQQLDQLRMATYVTEAGVSIVNAVTMIEARRARKQETSDIVPMKFDSHVLEKMLYAYNMYSGHSNEQKMREAFASMNFKPYTRTSGETVLVLEEDYMRALQGVKV